MLPVLVQPAGELEPLALAAGQRRQRLPQRQVAQPDVDDRLQPAPDVALCRMLAENASTAAAAVRSSVSEIDRPSTVRASTSSV